MNPLIVYVDSYAICGHTIFLKDQIRIEISSFLTQYPELHRFVLDHERKHSEFSRFSWRHFWIDAKDRIRLVWDPTIQRQLNDFRDQMKPKGLKEILFQVLYELFGQFHAVFILMPILGLRQIINLIRWINRKRRT